MSTPTVQAHKRQGEGNELFNSEPDFESDPEYKPASKNTPILSYST